jgi:hypothetical protein
VLNGLLAFLVVFLPKKVAASRFAVSLPTYLNGPWCLSPAPHN